MSEHQKFIFADFPKSAVVNSNVHSTNADVEEIINNVVAEHLSNIVEEESADHDEEQIPETDTSISEDVEVNAPSQVNLDDIRKEEYEKAMASAKAIYDPLIESKEKEKNFSGLLYEKLSSIVPEIDFESQITKISAESIAGIAKKLHLILPANFEEIINKGLIEKLKKFYKEGKIILTINPGRYEICSELLQSESIPEKFKDNFQIVKDESLGLDDCKIQWNDTSLEYNQEQLSSEIDKIIEQLRSTK
jgi:hypothetical protein